MPRQFLDNNTVMLNPLMVFFGTKAGVSYVAEVQYSSGGGFSDVAENNPHVAGGGDPGAVVRD